tara:strand:+ start:139 stop:1263 length:1125 start_codon:yes stop_codon:yes gene_type:complete
MMPEKENLDISSSESRSEIIANSRKLKLKNRPFIYLAVIFLIIITFIPVIYYVQTHITPYNTKALVVEDKIYSRGNVVDFIRFNQRISEEKGEPYLIGGSLFDALKLMSENEIAYQVAPKMGLTVEDDEIDEAFFQRIGYSDISNINQLSAETLSSLNEKKKQFLNSIQLDEDVFRDIIRKDLFRQKVADEVAKSISRIQPQAHIYKITLLTPNINKVREISRMLNRGDNIEDVIVGVSEDPEAKRTKGEIGWIPEGILNNLDPLFFGVDEDGKRFLEVKTLSEPFVNSELGGADIYVISEISEARELSDKTFSLLAENALVEFLNNERKSLYIYMDLNNEIYNWINSKVRLASVLPEVIDETDPVLSQFEGMY